MQNKIKHKRTRIIIMIIAFIVGIFIGMSYYMGIQVFAGSTQLVTNEETTGISDKFFESYGMNYEEFLEAYQVEEIEITSSFDGHVIPGDYIYAKQSSQNKNHKTVILVHGLGGNRYSNYPLAEMFLEKGYNVLTYDQRSSNENTAQYTTFGYWEKYDLIDCIDFVKENAPEQIIGIWSTSFGSATAGLALGYEDTDKLVDFLILDCPISSMKWMVEEQMRQMDLGIPVSYMCWCGNMINQIKLGFSYEDAEVAKAMERVETPVLIMNSKADEVTPFFMGQNIYEQIPGNDKQIWTVEDSAHADIWLDYNQEYREKVADLLEAVENKK